MVLLRIKEKLLLNTMCGGGLMQLVAYGAFDVYPDYDYESTYDYLIDNGYDPDKYDYHNDEKWVKYDNQLEELTQLLYNTKKYVTTITIWKYVEEEKNTCPVTYETINLKEYYYHCSQCKNNYKNEVYNSWLREYGTCPVCRYNININIRYFNTKNIQPKSDNHKHKHKIRDLEFRIKKLKEYMKDIEWFYNKKNEDYKNYIYNKAKANKNNKSKKSHKKCKKSHKN